MKLVTALLIATVTVAVGASNSFAQSNPVFMQLGQAKGALYKPIQVRRPTSALWSCIGNRTT